MRSKLTRGLALSLIVVWSLAAGGPQGKKAVFDGQAAYEYVKVLASDAMLGRKAASPAAGWRPSTSSRDSRSGGLSRRARTAAITRTMTIEYHDVRPGAALDIIAARQEARFRLRRGLAAAALFGFGPFCAPRSSSSATASRRPRRNMTNIPASTSRASWCFSRRNAPAIRRQAHERKPGSRTGSRPPGSTAPAAS